MTARVHQPVSIRARHCWRACGTPATSNKSSPQFQSAPAIAGERVAAASVGDSSVRVFQSAPAIAGERVDHDAIKPGTVVMFQSAPAIAGERVPW